MQCISIRQPWALLVCAGQKVIENRTWASTHRGVVAVHTGSFQLGVPQQIDPSLRRLFAFGAIIGTVEIYNVVTIEQAKGEDWAEGPFCFRLRNARLFSCPIPHKGRVGISRLPDDIATKVAEHSQDIVDIVGSQLTALLGLFPPAPLDKALLRRVERYGG
jgi:hypothetical protein